MKHCFILTVLVAVLVLVLVSIHVIVLASTDAHSIDAVYAGDSFITVDNESKGPMYNLTYGEITEEGIKNIVGYLKANKVPTSTYIDLGSGNGRSLAYATKNGFSKAKGVEIVEERHKYALNAIDQLPEYKDDIELLHADLFNLSPTFFPPESTVFVSNLLFPPETNQNLFHFLSDNTPNDVTLIVSTIPTNLYKYKIEATIDMPMSWAHASTCYVLRK
jgi:SAM-dependent methyltransferase